MMMNKYNETKKVSILSLIGNLFLLFIKGVISIITHSSSMLADTMNSLGDILSSLMTFIGNKISSKEKDEDHHLGHGKAEYIYSLLISVVLIYMSLECIKTCLSSLIFGNTFIFSIWLIIVCIITILIKLCLYLYTSKIYQRNHNILVKASSMDHRNDCILTFFNLCAIICSYYHFYFIDSVIGIGISLWILKSGVELFRESYDVLMDKAMSEENKDKVYSIIKKYPEIKKVNHFNTTPVGYQYQISFTIFVDGNLSTYESHAIANRLEKEIDNKLEEVYLTVIHVNPWKEERFFVK